MRALVIFGTRPEAIKFNSVIRELKNQGYDMYIINTGQHGRMLDLILEEYKIVPDASLKLHLKCKTIFEYMPKMIFEISNIIDILNTIANKKFDVTIVQGDTASAFAGAFVSYLKKIPIAHIEAGLRSWNKYNPFPEEIFRNWIDTISDYHFCPTYTDLLNLSVSGVHKYGKKRVYVTGNTAIDNLYRTYVCKKFSKKVIVTIHRRETWDTKEKFCTVMDSIFRIAQFCPELEFVIVNQENPYIRELLKHLDSPPNNLLYTESLSHKDFLYEIAGSFMVITDSGGIQEETCALGVPTLLLRDSIERVENIDSNCLLAGTDKYSIVRTFAKIYRHRSDYDFSSDCYGKGNAAQKIVDTLELELLKCD